jgi:two-component system chemotaxis response regulator CheB
MKGIETSPHVIRRDARRAVVIGASAGALEALSHILPALSAGSPLSIMIVVHLPPERQSLLPEILAARCPIEIKEAEDTEIIRPGVVYIAPPDYHLLVEPDLSLSLSNEEPVLYSRPSIDVLFESAADAYGDALIGIVLTGANSDGANGARAVANAGGLVLVQDPDDADASAMPRAALQACPTALALTLAEIADCLSSNVPAC